MFCPIDSFNHTTDGIDDLVSAFMPDQRRWLLIVVGKRGSNAFFEVSGRATRAALWLFFGQAGEKPFDEIDTQGVRRHEVKLKARMPQQSVFRAPVLWAL